MLRNFTRTRPVGAFSHFRLRRFTALLSFPFVLRRQRANGSGSFLGFPLLLDGLSRWFVLLTRFLIPFTFLIGVRRENTVVLRRSLFLLELALLGTFLLTELLSFYLLFERVLMPMFILILVYGSRERRSRAAYQLFLYTVAFSLFLLVRCVWLQGTMGTTDWRVLLEASSSFPPRLEARLFASLFLRLAVKVPMVPVHLWLPEAHTEASTEGSVILAGVLLKLGTYGMIRFLLSLFPWARAQRAPFRITLSAIRVVTAALTCIRQSDLKKLIAYSSVSHMGLVTLGLFRGNLSSQLGRSLMMITHGVVRPALFLCVGLLYERFGTRTLDVYGGIATRMPLFSIVWRVAVFSNMAIPGTAGFPAEFLILTGSFQEAKLATRISSFGIILTRVYCVRLYNLVLGGVLKPHMMARADLNRQEVVTRRPFVLLMFRRGVRPLGMIESLERALYSLT